jgi:predicted RNA-binding Zn-ribbon protein involved in translation (DUF1610 family)
MKKMFDSNIVGPFYSVSHGKVLEDTINFICDLCGNRIKKKISYSSFSKICIFPKIEDYEKLKCRNCGEMFHIMKIKRKFSKSNERVEYKIIGDEIKKKDD